MAFQITALLILAAFYGMYFGKMLSQKRRGIRTDAIAKDKTDRKRYRTELVMKAATYITPAAEVLSIVSGASLLPFGARAAGAVLGICGDVFFGLAAVTMADSWRAGVAANEHRAFVSKGVFKISRNPAFFGFDLVYLGVLLMFFNPVLLVVSLWAAVMLHLQILQEEKYLAAEFGERYTAYKKNVRRYLGFKIM